jgi:hypothetical protein
MRKPSKNTKKKKKKKKKGRNDDATYMKKKSKKIERKEREDKQLIVILAYTLKLPFLVLLYYFSMMDCFLHVNDDKYVRAGWKTSLPVINNVKDNYIFSYLSEIEMNIIA